MTPDTEPAGGGRRRALLRQLRDLDDDLAAGKLTDADHRRLRDPLEREAAAALRRERDESAAALRRERNDTAAGPRHGQEDTTAAPPGERSETAAARRHKAAARRGGTEAVARIGAEAGRGGAADRTPRAARQRRRVVAAVAAVAAAAGVAVLLAGAIAPRGAGGTATGDAPAAEATAPSDASAGAPAAGSAGPPAQGSAGPTMTAEQATTIDAAALEVKAHPRDVAKHLTLAHAYADGGASQLAAVEYLAILRLDPANAEANTALALLAFEVGQPQQAKDMLDRVLAADPAYPEALYVRGLVLLSGLHQPRAALQDLDAYLAAAPYGSHRTAAETLRALAGSQL